MRNLYLENFWILKLETLHSKGLDRELTKNVVPHYPIFCTPTLKRLFNLRVYGTQKHQQEYSKGEERNAQINK